MFFDPSLLTILTVGVGLGCRFYLWILRIWDSSSISMVTTSREARERFGKDAFCLPKGTAQWK